MRRVLSIAIVSSLAPLGAQSPVPAPGTKVLSAVAANAAAEPFTYHADGRRDPFLSLLNPEPESRPAPRKGDGLGSLTLAEITVRGIMQSRDLLVAMIAGPDNKTYIVHEGDRLLDGQITSITREGLVIVQRATDPLSRVKQRETRKLLQSLEAAKE